MQLTVEARQKLAVRLLAELNRPGSQQHLIGNLLKVLKQATGLEAIGIRLPEGDDYPYFEQTGLSADFIKTENSLCIRTPSGQIALDRGGQPLLDCICGKIIRNRTEPDKPYFTPAGSFWTNSTTGLVRTLSDQERSQIRGRCSREGYESVALIPLHADQGTVGLLHFCDHRPDCFTPELIDFFEEIAASIAIAFKRLQTQEKVRQLEEKLLQTADRTAQRIGHDLHDSLGQLLTGITLIGKALQTRLETRNAPEAAQASRIVMLAQQAVSQSRSLARGLSPVRIGHMGLEEALRELADDIGRCPGISCTFDSPATIPPLDHSVAAHLYHIAQEATTNALKHASPSRIGIACRVAGGQLVLSISDNGKGVSEDSETAKPGLGIDIMKYRGDVVGGVTEFEPNKGGGTVVRCTVPLTDH